MNIICAAIMQTFLIAYNAFLPKGALPSFGQRIAKERHAFKERAIPGSHGYGAGKELGLRVGFLDAGYNLDELPGILAGDTWDAVFTDLAMAP